MNKPNTLRQSVSAAVLCAVASCFAIAQGWQSDNGNGTFTNPVLYADYPDPDIIRVGSDFFMVSSTFVNSPGINLLKSKDMVNWELTARIASTVDGGDAYNMVNGTAYEAGYWAPSIRHHNGTFYVAVQPTFANGRIYYASNPAGPWSYHQLDRGIYDPGLFIDTDGTGYIVCGHNPQSLMTLNASFSQIVTQQDNFLNSTAEGSHMVKRGSYYYVFNAKPSVWPFELRCSRTTNLTNPVWETRAALTAVTGGHQGAIVDINDGDEWFGFVHQDSGAIGRMPRIGPVFWENDWPVFGTTAERDVMGASYPKPVAGQPITQPAPSDDFGVATLGLQWAWNHNPDNARWSLSERPGFLRLKPTQASGFWTARNTLTQKPQGPRSQGVVKFDLSNLQAGDIAGFGTLGKINGHIAVNVDAGGVKTLSMHVIHDKVGAYTAASGVPVTGNTLFLRADLDFVRNLGICSYSTDGVNFTTLGGNFQLMFGYGSTFQGEQFALFCYNQTTASSAGHVDVDSFAFTALEDNADLVQTQRDRATLNAMRTTFVADNGQLLRGPYESTEWTTAAPEYEVARIKELGFNTVHLYAESFDLYYPNVNPNTGQVQAPGYAEAEIDKFVQMTRDLGLYLVITIGNGANNGNHNKQWAVDFWTRYASRYANETHVLYEIHNEPMAWGPSYLTGTTPAGALNMEVDCYNIIRQTAPDTPVLLFSYAVLGETDGASAALTDIQEFNTQVFGNANAVWTNEAVGFHGYAGWEGTSTAVASLIAAGYPCFMTEFGADDWGSGGGLDVELTAQLERLGVSWAAFLTIPPYGVSWDVTVPAYYKDLADKAGLSWTPDYGTWPVARGVYGNGGLPRNTPGVDGSMIDGTLRIDAEDFDTGGQGVAYNDVDTVNWAGQYRTSEGVDITGCGDTGGGYAVGWTANGEWMEYTVFVKEPGYHNLSVRYATPNSDCAVRTVCNGRNVTGTLSLPVTGGFGTWSTLTQEVFLEYGRQKMRFEIPTGGFDLNWIEISPSNTGPIADGTYKLANRNSGQTMTYDTTNHVVFQNPYLGASTAQWDLQHLGAGQYKVTSASNGDSWNVGAGSGNPLGIVWWWGIEARHQRFIVRPTGDGYYRIAPVALGRDFEVGAASQSSGASVLQHEYAGLSHQQWAIQPPSATAFPSGVSALWVSSTQVNVTWTAAAGSSSYNVKRATVSGGPYTTIASGVAGAGYADTSVTAGITYYYVVSAVSGSGESLNSMEATANLLHAHLKLDETSGMSASDSTGGGWNGTLVNGPLWATGKMANAAQLDGTNDYVSLPSGVVNGLSECTVAAWVNVSAASNWARLFDFGTGTGNYMYLAPKNGANGYVRFGITTGSGEQVIDSSAALQTGIWNHLAVTIKGTTGILYVNGVEKGRNSWMTLTPASLGTTMQNFIGKSQWADPYLDGKVDDFRIYANALDALDVAALHSPQEVNPAAAPSVTTGLSVTAYSTSTVLNWSSSVGATSYNIKRATVSGGPYTLVSSVGTPGYTDYGLTNGTTYYYVVSAVNDFGESSNSLQASATPVNSAITNGISIAAQDGYVRSSNNSNTTGGSGYPTANPCRLGDDSSNRQYKAILSFDTSSIPAGATIVSATVRMKRSGLTGADPFTTHGTCYMDVKNGGFNGNVALEASDFQASADATQVATMSNPGSNGAWSTGSLNAAGLALMSKGGVTQLRVYFSTPANNDNGNDYVSWYSGNDASEANWPTLEVAYAYTPAGTSPSAWLRFDETSGTSAADSSDNGWTGTLTNGPGWTAGHDGNAVSLDGIDDHVTLPNGVVSGLTNFTVCTWVKLNSPGTWTRIFDFGTGGDNYMMLTPQNGITNVARFTMVTPVGGEQIIEGNATLPIGTWTHVAVTLSGSVGTLYVNGVVVGTNGAMTVTPSSLGDTTVNYIGWSQFGWDAHLNADMDDFRIYNSAMSASNIAALASPPSVPAGVGATPGNAKITLNWSAANGALSYTVKRATVGGPFTTILSGFAGTSYTDFGVTNGTTYYYVVSAVNGLVESANSAQVSAAAGTLTPAPVITSSLSADGTNGSAFSYQITASNSPTSYGATGLPAGLSVDTGTGLISGTPSAAGAFVVTLGVSNGSGSGTAMLHLTVVVQPISESEMKCPSVNLTQYGTQITTESSVVGHSYRLEASPDLSPGSWEGAGETLDGTGAPLLFEVPRDPEVTRRFYRIRISAL